MKYNVNGRDLEIYQMNENELREVALRSNLSEEERKEINDAVLSRFSNDLCEKGGESADDVFVRTFSKFVNGKMRSATKVAEGMAREHRYLQHEMFKVCLEYIKILAANAENGYYDARNEYACNVSKHIIDALNEKGVWY